MHDPIPPELALIVATHLRRGKALKTLASLASVSRGYSDVITPVLYRRITLTNENLIPLMAGIDDEDMVVTRLAGRKGANLWFLCEILEIIGPLNAMSEFRVKVWSSIHSTLFGAHTLVLITSPGQQPYIPPKRLCSPRKVCVTSLGPASSGMRMDAAADAAEAWSAKLNIHNPIAKLCEKPRNSLEIRRFWQHCVDQDYGALGCTSSSGRFGRYPCCQYDMVGRAFQLVTRLAKMSEEDRKSVATHTFTFTHSDDEHCSKNCAEELWKRCCGGNREIMALADKLEKMGILQFLECSKKCACENE